MAGQLIQGRRSESPARAKLADGFEQIGLARAIGAIKADMPAIQSEVELGIIAKIRQAKARNGGQALNISLDVWRSP